MPFVLAYFCETLGATPFSQTQTVLPSAETAMLFSALLASGQITMRKVEVGPPRYDPKGRIRL